MRAVFSEGERYGGFCFVPTGKGSASALSVLAAELCRLHGLSSWCGSDPHSSLDRREARLCQLPGAVNMFKPLSLLAFPAFIAAGQNSLVVEWGWH